MDRKGVIACEDAAEAWRVAHDRFPADRRGQNHKTNCPYLVGSYECVAHELARYIAAGYRTLILDIPPNQEELAHINMVLTKAIKEAQNGGVVTAISDQTG